MGDLTVRPKDMPCCWEGLQVFLERQRRKEDVSNSFLYLEGKKSFFVKRKNPSLSNDSMAV